MPGKAAVVLTAATLSVTVGVLIGIVLILGNKARQPPVSSAPSPVATAPLTDSSAPPDDGDTVQISVLQAASSPGPSPSAPPGAAVAPAPTTHSTTSRPVATPGRPVTTSRPATTSRSATTSRTAPTTTTPTRPTIVFTTVTVAEPTSSSVLPTPTRAPATTTTPTTATTAPTATASSASNGAPAPAGPCAALGDRATAAGGFTVFCQHDFSNGSLAWRAVVDGGGCLSKKMTGIGTDGQHYLCRPDRKGLDHWRRA